MLVNFSFFGQLVLDLHMLLLNSIPKLSWMSPDTQIPCKWKQKISFGKLIYSSCLQGQLLQRPSAGSQEHAWVKQTLLWLIVEFLNETMSAGFWAVCHFLCDSFGKSIYNILYCYFTALVTRQKHSRKPQDFLPSISFSQSHVPVKSISCIQGEVKQRLVCLLVCFFFPERVPQDLRNLSGPSFSPQIQPNLIKIVLAQLGTTWLY